MTEEFTQVLAKLSKQDKDILACANVLRIHPLAITKVEWYEGETEESNPRLRVTVRVPTDIHGSWREGTFPWTEQNLPTEKTTQIEEFLQRVRERDCWRRR